MSKFEDAIQTVLSHEGSQFTNDPADPGGATKFGVTLYSLKESGMHDLDGTLFADVNHDGRIDINDIKALDESAAKEYYQSMWWDHYQLGKIFNQQVATKVFDTAVNMGGITAIKMLQQAACALDGFLTVDGALGPKTLQQVNSCDPVVLLKYYRQYQASRYLQLIAKNPSLEKFKNGWLARAAI